MLVGVERVDGRGAVRGRSGAGAAALHRRAARGLRAGRSQQQVWNQQPPLHGARAQISFGEVIKMAAISRG